MMKAPLAQLPLILVGALCAVPACSGPSAEDVGEASAAQSTIKATWDVMPSTVGPTNVATASCVYDTAGDRVVFFGGGEGPDAAMVPTPTWAWNGSAFSIIAPAAASPAPRSGGAMVYDELRERVVYFGGRTSALTTPTDVWELGPGGWTQIVVPAGAAGTKPRGRWQHAMAYDGARQRTVLFGGQDALNIEHFGDTWEWDGSAWTNVTPTWSPPALSRATASFVPGTGVVLYGGTPPSGGLGAIASYRWDGAAWSPWEDSAPQGPRPGGLVHSAHDPARGMIVLGNTQVEQKVAAWALKPGEPWRSLEAGGVAPSYDSCLAFFTSRKRVVAIDAGGAVRELRLSTVGNQAPTFATLSNRSVYVGDEVRIDLDATDPDDSALTFGVVGAPAGSSFDGRTFRWVPTTAGTRSVKFTVSDGLVTKTKTVTLNVTSNAYALLAAGPVRLRAEAIGIGGTFHNCQHRGSIPECQDDPGGTVLWCSVEGVNPGKVTVACGLHHKRRPDGTPWSVSTVMRTDGSFTISAGPRASDGGPVDFFVQGKVTVSASGDPFLQVDAYRETINDREWIHGMTSAPVQLIPQ